MIMPAFMFSFICLIIRQQAKRVKAMQALMKLPDDAVSLPTSEARTRMEEMLGEWRIVPLAAGNARFGFHTAAFQTAYVEAGNAPGLEGVDLGKVTLSGGYGRGRKGRMRALQPQTQPIRFSRTPDGTLYVDSLGTKVERWAAPQGEITFHSALGLRFAWRRDAGGLPGAPPLSVAQEQQMQPMQMQPMQMQPMQMQPMQMQQMQPTQMMSDWLGPCGHVNQGGDQFCGGCGSPAPVQPMQMQPMQPVVSVVDAVPVDHHGVAMAQQIL